MNWIISTNHLNCSSTADGTIARIYVLSVSQKHLRSVAMKWMRQSQHYNSLRTTSLNQRFISTIYLYLCPQCVKQMINSIHIRFYFTLFTSHSIQLRSIGSQLRSERTHLPHSLSTIHYILCLVLYHTSVASISLHICLFRRCVQMEILTPSFIHLHSIKHT